MDDEEDNEINLLSSNGNGTSIDTMGCGSSKQNKVVKFTEPSETPKSSKKPASPVNKINNSKGDPSSTQPEQSLPKQEPSVQQADPPIEENTKSSAKIELKPKTSDTVPETKTELIEKQKYENEVDKTTDVPFVPESYLVSDRPKISEENKKTLLTYEKTFFTQKIDFDRKLCRISSVTKPSKPADKLTILHFNDVYNIEPRDKEPVGGAARFVTKVRSFTDDPLILFSGDVLNPSLMSTITKGKQMVPVMNNIGVHAAVYGNHDFDFGVDELVEFKKNTTFPWLMSNVEDKLTKTLLADGVEKIICEWHGRKIGIIGLVEKEWLVTLATIDPEDVEYIDFIECARDLVQKLRNEEGCELIIALTHMRVPNDLKLLESDINIDLVLGGHDHHYETKQHDGKQFVKSGTDFRELTEITVDFSSGNNNRVITTQRHEVTSDIIEDEATKAECDKFLGILGQKMEDVLGHVNVDLDGRFSTVRTKESNLGNFVCDIIRAATQSDIAIINSGSFRSDTVHEAGPFKVKDLVSILPMADSLVVLKITGKTLVEALENSVSQYPKYEGRFLQVSGISFVFDPLKPSGDRVLNDSIKVHDNIPINMEQEYTVVTKEYLSRGKDGFDMLTSSKVLVDAESGPVLISCVENYFESVRIYKGKRRSVSGHRQSITVKHDEVQSFMEMQRSKLSPQLSPTFVRRKSKLRLRPESSLQTQVSSGDLGEIQESEEELKQDIIEPTVEEVGTQSDSDIDSVMQMDDTREQIPEDQKMDLWEACRTDDLEKMNSIIGDRTLDFKYWIMEKTLMHHAAQHNSIKSLEYLIKETNLKVHIRDQILKGTPLFYAAEHGSKEAAVVLIDNGASVNAKNTLWETPLHAACENEKGNLIITLLNRGADRTAKNKEGEKPKI